MSEADVLAVLKSIDLSLRKLVVIAERKAEERVKAAQNTPARDVASDADLDGKYGDPIVKARDPKDWTGEPQQGKRQRLSPSRGSRRAGRPSPQPTTQPRNRRRSPSLRRCRGVGQTPPSGVWSC